MSPVTESQRRQLREDPDHPGVGGGDEFVHWDDHYWDEGYDVTDFGADHVHDHGTEAFPRGLQGVLLLNDVSENQGTFQCVPGAFPDPGAFVEERGIEENGDLLEEGHVDRDEVVRVPGEAGDLVVWDTRTPHGNGRNTADRPRYAQYVNMEPDRFWAGDPDRYGRTREDRIRLWRERTQGNDPRNWEQKHAETAELTSLGEKLLGIAPWPNSMP